MYRSELPIESFNEYQNYVISEQFTNKQENVDAFPGETVKLITELPESGLEVTWLKDNVPLSTIDGKYETINKDCSYQLLVADVTTEDSGSYAIQGGGFESKVSLSVLGKRLENIHETFLRKFCTATFLS